MVRRTRILNSVVLSGRTLLLPLLSACLLLASCQKKQGAYDADRIPGIKVYAEQTGTTPQELYNFTNSLKKLQSSDGSSSSFCLLRLTDTDTSRNNFLNCLSQKGLFGLNKAFLEELVGVRLERQSKVHNPEAAKTLRLLNWIYDISLEQYALTNPTTYWLEKDQWGKWYFTESKKFGEQRKNQDDYNFQEGDLVLSVSPTELSTLIPQYTYPQRRLTHVSIYRGASGYRKEHFLEAEFEEGVRYRYRDTYREKESPYETIVMRYNDLSRHEDEVLKIRKRATEYAVKNIGKPYGFSMDKNKGYFCVTLCGIGYADAEINLDRKVKDINTDDVAEIFGTTGFSPLRKGASRYYAEKFGVDLSKLPENERLTGHIAMPTSGDFLSAKNFEPIAIYANPEKVKKFSDLYTVAEATVDALDRGSEIVISAETLEKFEPMMRDRPLIVDIIGMARELKRHTLIRDEMKKQKLSLETVEQLSTTEFKDILKRLTNERNILVEAAKKEIGFGIMENAFGYAKNLKYHTDPNNPHDNEPEISSATFFASVLGSKGTGKFTNQDIEQLKLFMENLNFEKMKKILRTGTEDDFGVKMPLLGELVKIIDKKFVPGSMTREQKLELDEITKYLRTYAVFLLYVPELQKKVDEVKEETLQDVLKQAPYVASALSKQTLIEFGAYKKIASGIVEKFDEVRVKMKSEYLWQTPPWIQRVWMDYILSQVSVVRYK